MTEYPDSDHIHIIHLPFSTVIIEVRKEVVNPLFPHYAGRISGGGALELQVRMAYDQAGVDMPLLCNAEVFPQLGVAVNGVGGKAAVEGSQP